MLQRFYDENYTLPNLDKLVEIILDRSKRLSTRQLALLNYIKSTHNNAFQRHMVLNNFETKNKDDELLKDRLQSYVFS